MLATYSHSMSPRTSIASVVCPASVLSFAESGLVGVGNCGRRDSSRHCESAFAATYRVTYSCNDRSSTMLSKELPAAMRGLDLLDHFILLGCC